jgi:hypothetical protein
MNFQEIATKLEESKNLKPDYNDYKKVAMDFAEFLGRNYEYLEIIESPFKWRNKVNKGIFTHGEVFEVFVKETVIN